MSTIELIKKVIIKTLPVMAGYIVLGIGFGILLKVNGYGLFWALIMSVFIFAGSAQYVGISLITGGASVITTALTILFVNARHLFYGISMLDKYKGAGAKKPYLIFALSDETYSLVCDGKHPEGSDKYKYWFLISLFDQIYWVVGSIIGSILGGILVFDSTGIDFSMTALFITVFVEQWLSVKEHRPALIGLIGSAICLLVFGADRFLIPSMVVIVLMLSLCKKTFEKKEEQGNE